MSSSPENPKKTFTKSEVQQACLKYFDGDELACSVWMSKYALKIGDDEFLEKTPEQMHRRMAKEFARIEERNTITLPPLLLEQLSDYGKQRPHLNEETIFSLFDQFRFVIPQGSVMAALGNHQMIASLSNCVVLPAVYDSYGGIFRTDEQLAQLFKRRCGVGIDLSTLRPAGFAVSNAAGSSSGAVSFMERFSNTTREVSQHGRRGALMMTMDIAHPDIEAFITSKQDLKKITGANISVRLSDDFMHAVEQNKPFLLRWPVEGDQVLFKKNIDARALWRIITESAYLSAEPGIIFWDRQHRYSTSSIYPGFKNTSTNPCSEIAMQGGDSCRLMALNLFSFVHQPFTSEARFDEDLFYRCTYEAQRLMDDLVDLELESIRRILEKISQDPEPQEIKQTERNIWELLYENGRKGRRTGLGFTALADTLAAMGIKFDSPEALKFAGSIMKIKCLAEFDSSVDMAIERGPFEGFSAEIESTSEFVDMLRHEFPDLFLRMMKNGRRNISISTVAPTGSLSLLSQTSSGIEPVFMLSYKRRKKLHAYDTNTVVDFTDALGDRWQEFTVHHPKLRLWMEITGNLNEKESPYFQATASDIDWKNRVALQAVVQKYTTHSISSTINLPAQTPADVVGSIFFFAWKAGLKGLTVYREGCRQGVLIAEESTSAHTKKMEYVTDHPAPVRPAILEAEVLRFMNHDEKWVAFVGLLYGRPYEIFTGRAEDALSFPLDIRKGWIVKNKTSGSDIASYDFQYLDASGNRCNVERLSQAFNQEYWNYAKLISGVLRHGMPLPEVLELISNLRLYSDHINTWKNGVERALRRYLPSGTFLNGPSCSNCGDEQSLVFQEGCIKCRNCGFSKCG